MGFYFRRSISFGPFRLNFSKSGIGVSAGVKGARVSTGPRGTYVHAGSHGFYYSQKIGQSDGSPSPKPQQPSQSIWPPSTNAFVIESADVSQLRETSVNDVLNQINDRASQSRAAPWAIAATIGTTLIGCVLVSALASFLGRLVLEDRETTTNIATFAVFIAAMGILTAGGLLSWQIHKGDELKRTTHLFYELEPEAVKKFDVVKNACSALSQSERVWRVQTNQPTWDWKRNAGASSLITRQPAFVGLQRPPYIATNVDVWGMRLNDMNLFFMPDYVLVRQNNMYGAVAYDSLIVSFAPTRFIEDQGVPRDSQVLDHTWRFVNKKGGPDRRFSNNYQIPIVQYGFLQFESNTGLNIHFHVSSIASANEFANRFLHKQSRQQQEPRRDEPRGKRQEPRLDPKIRIAYDTLGVSVAATSAEIVSAYRNMAKMYHPDKLANLAPEFIELAEERMKEINAAYEILKRR